MLDSAGTRKRRSPVGGMVHQRNGTEVTLSAFHALRPLVIAGLASLLACGGSSGTPDPAPSAPVLLSTVPADGASGVPATAKVQFVFDSALDPATVTTSSVLLQAGANLVGGSVSYDAPTRTVRFSPAVALEVLTGHEARITTAVKGANGLPVAHAWRFSFTTGPDVTSPSVLATTPVDGATGVATSAVVSATFDEAMDPSSVTSYTFLLSQGGTRVDGAVAYDPFLRTATFTPGVALTYLAPCTATLTTGISDAAGNALASSFSWSFVVQSDTDSPTVVGVSPLDGATGVPIDAPVSVTFDEPLDPLTVGTATFKLVGEGGREVPASVLWDEPSRTATLVPRVPLAFLTTYTAIAGAGLSDPAGNPLSGPFSWAFRTIPDTFPPSVTSRAPAPGALDVPVAAPIVVEFDEQMDPATLTTSSFSVTAGGVAVPGIVIYDPGKRTATFVPVYQLPYLASCEATVTTEATDLAGNPLASAVSWTFTLEADAIPPEIVYVFPAENATSVSVSTPVFVSFSEPIDPATISTLTVSMRTQDGPVDASVYCSPDSRTAQLVPDAWNHIAGSTTYTVEVTNGIADLAGNRLAAGRSWSFTTGPDLVPPSVLWVYPRDGAADVPTRTMVHVCFDEPMSTAAVAIDVDGVSTTFSASTPNCVARDMTFAMSATPRITVTTAAKDLAGNALAAPYSWTFRTIPDATPPTIVAISPVDGARFVSASSPGLSVSFSEAMDPASVAQSFAVAGVSGTVALQGGTKAVFTPSTPLAPGATYTATVSTAAKDLAGNPLASPVTFSFQTAPATTSRLSPDSQASARAPVVAFDASGNAMAAWIIDTGTGALLATSYRPFGQGWGVEQVLDVAPEGSFGELNLVPQGNRFGLGYVRARNHGSPEAIVRFAAAGAWEAETVLGASSAGPRGLRLVAGTTTWIAAWGDAAVQGTTARVWSDGGWGSALSTGGPGQGGTPVPTPFAIAAVADTLHLVALGFGPRVDAYVWSGTWSGATTLSDLFSTYMGAVGSIAAAPGPAGVVVAWTLTDNTWPATLATTNVIARVLSGGTWGPRQPLRAAVNARASPLLVGSSSATTVVAFSQGGALHAAVLSGGSWTLESVPGGDGAPTALVANDSAFAIAWNSAASTSVSIRSSTWDAPLQAPGASSLGLAAGPSGFAWAFGGASASSAVVYSGGTWGSPSPLEGATAGLALASSGGGYGIVWGHGAAMNAADFSTAWSSPTNLLSRSYPASAFDPHVAVSGTRALMAWRQHDASSGVPRAVPHAAAFDGSSWSTPFALDAHAERFGEVLATGPDEFAVSWIDGSGARKLQRYSFATGAWAAASEVASSSSTSVFTVAHTGTEFLAAFDDAGALLSKRSPDGSTWSPAVTLAAAASAKLVAGGGVTMLVTWGGGSSPVTASRYAGEGMWDPAELLGTLLPTNNTVSAAVNATGGVGVAFDADVPTDDAGFAVRLYDSGTWAARRDYGTTYPWDRPHPRISGSAGGWLHTSTGSQGFSITARVVTAESPGAPVVLSTRPADHSPASSGASHCALLTENASPTGFTGPVVYCFAGALYSAAAPLDTAPGYFADAVLSADPVGSAMLAGWTRSDPTTAARVLMAAFGP